MKSVVGDKTIFSYTKTTILLQLCPDERLQKKKTILYPTNTSGILVRAAKPVSVIWRLSRLRFFSELKPEIFFKPMSVINVKERLMLCKLRRPAETEQLNICF